MKQTYRVLAGLIALGVVVQAAAIAFGWFEVLSDLENGPVIDENAEFNVGQILHLFVGMFVMPLLACPAGRLLLRGQDRPGRPKWAGIVFGRSSCRSPWRPRLRLAPVSAPCTASTRWSSSAPPCGPHRWPAPRPGAGGGSSAAPARRRAGSSTPGSRSLSDLLRRRWRVRPPRWPRSSSLPAGWAGPGSVEPGARRPTRSWTWASSTTAAGPRTTTAPGAPASPT